MQLVAELGTITRYCAAADMEKGRTISAKDASWNKDINVQGISLHLRWPAANHTITSQPNSTWCLWWPNSYIVDFISHPTKKLLSYSVWAIAAMYKAKQNQIFPSSSLSWKSAWKTVEKKKKKSIPGLFVKLCYGLKDMGLISYSFQFILMLLQCIMYILN